jgi:hypothetical protein
MSSTYRHALSLSEELFFFFSFYYKLISIIMMMHDDQGALTPNMMIMMMVLVEPGAVLLVMIGLVCRVSRCFSLSLSGSVRPKFRNSTRPCSRVRRRCTALCRPASLVVARRDDYACTRDSYVEDRACPKEPRH